MPKHWLRPSQQIPPPQTPTQIQKQENQKLNFELGDTGSYNGVFSLSERKEAIKKSHSTAVSLDEIHYQFLRQLPPKSLEYLLTALNAWTNNKLQESWKLATIIPISKPGNNNLYASNYFPIALTSFLCKTME